jgi:hypothetical protein
VSLWHKWRKPDPTAWLPALVVMSEHGNNWATYEDALYAHFRRDFIDSAPTFPMRRWSTKRRPESKGKARTFWHIVSSSADGETAAEDDRLPDLRRCERIRWPRPMIDDYMGKRLRWWRNQRGRSERVLIATSDFSYVVILEDRREYIMLWTAYHVEREHRRRKLERDWKQYHQAAQGL